MLCVLGVRVCVCMSYMLLLLPVCLPVIMTVSIANHLFNLLLSEMSERMSK